MRTEAFPRFLVLSLLAHAGIVAALYVGGWLDGGEGRRYSPTGFDLARVHAALERMRSAEPEPLPVAEPQEPARQETDLPPEEDVLGLGAKPRPRYRNSLAPTNLMEILEGEREAPEPVAEPEPSKQAEPNDSMDLEKAFGGSENGPGLTSSVETGAARQRASTGRGTVKAGGFAIGGKGEVSRADYERVLQKRLPQIQNCYQAALLENPDLNGKLWLRWSVSKSGEVEQVLIERSQLENSELHSCVVQEIAKTEFPKPEGGSVILRFPLMFSVEQN